MPAQAHDGGGDRGGPVVYVAGATEDIREHLAAVRGSVDGLETVLLDSAEEACSRCRTDPPACLVVTDRVDGDPRSVVAELSAASDGHLVFAPLDGDERLASDAIAAGADDYVPLRDPDGDPERDPDGDSGRDSDGDSGRDPDWGEGDSDGPVSEHRLVARIRSALADRPPDGATRSVSTDGYSADSPLGTDPLRDPSPEGASLVESLPGGVCLVRDGRIAAATDRFGTLSTPEGADPTGDAFDAVFPDAGGELLSDVEGGSDPAYLLAESAGAGDRDLAMYARSLRSDGQSGVVVLAHDVSDRKGRERRLARLHRTTREMLRTSDTDTIADLAVRTVVDTLDPLSASVYLYDRDDGELRVGATASGVVPSLDPPRTAGGAPPEEQGGFAWDVFVDGQYRVQRRDAAEEWVGSRTAVPLGDHGVLVVVDATADAFEGADGEFTRTLATNVELALDRAEREATILDRTDRLRERTETLDRLRRIDDVVRDIGQLLVRARDRSEIESGVCERLAAVEGWPLAWIGDRAVTDGRIRRRSCSDGGEFVDAVTAADPQALAAAPAGEALSDGDPLRVEDVVAHPGAEEWRSTALEFGFRSAMSIPLEHAGRGFGVLEVYGDTPDAFGDAERELLLELGEMIAYAAHAVERQRALLAGSGPELAVSIADCDDPFVHLAGDLAVALEVEGIVPRSSGGFLAYFSLAGDEEGSLPRAEAVATAVERRPEFGEFRALGDDGDRYEVRLGSSPVFERVTAHGGSVSAFRAGKASCSLRIGLASSVGVREFVAALRDRFPDVEVLAQRTAGGDDAGVDRPGEALTDRQREVLAVAYHGGFFEWPRESSGEDVAETLGIAPPTFHKHVRSAERKLVSRLLERGGVPTGE